MNFEERFRVVNDYAGNHGYATAFPNFHQANHEDGRGVVYGVVCLKPHAVEIIDVPISELGNPDSAEARFRAVNDYARNHGNATAFPNFHQADHGDGRGVVYGVVCLKPDAVEIIDVPISELGNPDSAEARFRAVNDYARNHGNATAFPNFHQADHGDGRGVVYGVVCLKPDAVEIIDVPISEVEPRFPIIRYKHSELGDHRRMETSVKVMENGRVDGRTTTWTSDHWEGFHGTVIVDFTDKPNCTIDSMCTSYGPRIIHSYGVNGVKVGDPSRTVEWTATIPQNELEHINDLSIVHHKSPEPPTAQQIKEWVDALEPIIKAISEASGPN